MALKETYTLGVVSVYNCYIKSSRYGVLSLSLQQRQVQIIVHYNWTDWLYFTAVRLLATEIMGD